MSQLDEASARLDAALDKLENAVRNRQSEAGRDGQGDAALEAELAKLRADFAALQETSSTVSRRLDDAIGRLKGVLADKD